MICYLIHQFEEIKIPNSSLGCRATKTDSNSHRYGDITTVENTAVLSRKKKTHWYLQDDFC